MPHPLILAAQLQRLVEDDDRDQRQLCAQSIFDTFLGGNVMGGGETASTPSIPRARKPRVLKAAAKTEPQPPEKLRKGAWPAEQLDDLWEKYCAGISTPELAHSFSTDQKTISNKLYRLRKGKGKPGSVKKKSK